MSAGRLLGGALLSLIFIAGVMKLQDPAGAQAYMAHGFAKSGVTGKLAEFGVDVAPFLPALLYVATVLEVLGGLALAVGFHKFGAFLLLAFLVPVTAVMHWPIGADGAMDQHEMVSLLKNVALAGAMLYILSSGGRRAAAVVAGGDKKSN